MHMGMGNMGFQFLTWVSHRNGKKFLKIMGIRINMIEMKVPYCHSHFRCLS